MELKDRLYQLRKENGYTQAELAEKIGVSRQTISNWELGTITPTTGRLHAISKLYNVSIDELLGEEESCSQTLNSDEKDNKETEGVGNNLKVRRRKHWNSTIAVISCVAILILVIFIAGGFVYQSQDRNRDLPMEQLGGGEIEFNSEKGFDLEW